MMDGQNWFDQPVKNNIRTNNNILKITTGEGDDYIPVCLLFYRYFNKHCKMIAIDLSKQQALDVDPKAIQQINFTANLDGGENKRTFPIIEEAKETILDFFTKNCDSIANLFFLM